MAFPKGLPKELRGLWKVQYAPRERALLKILSPKVRIKYRKMSYSKKIRVIDRIQSGGGFN